MFWGDCVGAFEVSDAARDFQDAVVGRGQIGPGAGLRFRGVFRRRDFDQIRVDAEQGCAESLEEHTERGLRFPVRSLSQMYCFAIGDTDYYGRTMRLEFADLVSSGTTARCDTLPFRQP
jgi:hypothetical protein